MMWAQVKKYGLILLLSLIANSLFAQDFQPVLFEYIPGSHIANPSNPFQENLKIETMRMSIGEVIPTIYCREHSKILYGIRYDLLYFNYDNWTITSNEPEYLHFLRNELTIIQDISDHWQVTGLVNIGLATDLKKKINWDDFHLHSYVYLSKVMTGISYGVGVIYTSDFGSPLFLPLLQGYWKPSDLFRFEMLLPKNISFWFIPNENSEIGIRSMVYGNQYHMGEFTNDGKDVNLHYSVITLGPAFKYRIFNCFLLLVEGGYTLHRRFEIKNGGFSEKLNPENSYYVRAGLVFRPKL